MVIKSYRSLDRSVQFFGISGRFLIPAGAGAAASVVMASVIGTETNGLVGVAAFLVLFFGCASLVVALQGSISEKALFRKMASFRYPRYIHVKPKRLISGWRSTEQ